MTPEERAYEIVMLLEEAYDDCVDSKKEPSHFMALKRAFIKRLEALTTTPVLGWPSDAIRALEDAYDDCDPKPEPFMPLKRAFIERVKAQLSVVPADSVVLSREEAIQMRAAIQLGDDGLNIAYEYAGRPTECATALETLERAMGAK